MCEFNAEKKHSDHLGDSHASQKARAFSKVFATRPSRNALRAMMLEKSRRVMEGGLDPVVVREYR